MDFEAFCKNIDAIFPGTDLVKMERFKALGPLYREWNEKINVISRKDIDNLYIHHVLHSLSIAKYIMTAMPETAERMLGNEEGYRQETVHLLDVGTGGGFPGIPLAIMFPEAHFTLCDSIGKKITVASGIAKELKLKNVTAVNARAESLERKFDFVVSRAVTSLSRFMPWVTGKYGTGILYLKGGDIAEEIAEAAAKGVLKERSVSTVRITDWIKDPYFDGKAVIFIES